MLNPTVAMFAADQVVWRWERSGLAAARIAGQGDPPGGRCRPEASVQQAGARGSKMPIYAAAPANALCHIIFADDGYAQAAALRIGDLFRPPTVSIRWPPPSAGTSWVTAVKFEFSNAPLLTVTQTAHSIRNVIPWAV
jgi:hypothetical protein